LHVRAADGAQRNQRSSPFKVSVMKFDFSLGSFAIVSLMTACGGTHAGDPGSSHGAGNGVGDGTGASSGNATGGSNGDGTGASNGVGTGTGGSDGVGLGDAGASDDEGATGGSTGDGPSGAGGSKSDGQGEAGAPTTTGGEMGGSTGGGSGDAGGSKSVGDGNAGSSDDDGGKGPAIGGSGGRSSAGGSGGLPASGGAGGLANGGSSGGLPASGGSGDTSSSGGSGGLPASGGSGGLPASGGSGASAGDGSGDQSLDPEYLFTKATFGGNGRTCVTCHTAETGTISADQVQALAASNPSDPLFQPIDSDDGSGDDYSQLRAHATFRVAIPLPAGVSLTSDPSATSVVFRRSVPTTINTPALDSIIMWDGREPSLTSQAQDAIAGHAQGTVIPTSDQLQLIAQFEQGPDFFSSDLLREYSQGGPEPTWPPGVTDSEQRGRRWFAQDSAAPRFNICGQCHGGPMANTTQSNSGLPVGKRFQTVNVSEFNELGNPTFEFTFPDPNNAGKTVTVTSPDPGRALVTGDVRDLNFFKIPSLWGVKNTAPYFHDSSANTLEELVDHYEKHLATFLRRNVSYPTPHVPTTDDKADIVAYLKLL
jgi:cytochrome c peroxidase